MRQFPDHSRWPRFSAPAISTWLLAVVFSWIAYHGHLYAAARGNGQKAVSDEKAQERMASTKNERSPDSIERCARLYRGKRYASARTCFEVLAKADPQNPLFSFALGYCHYRLGDYQKAETWFKRSVEHNPKDGDARFMLGSILARLHRYPEALTQLRLAMRLGMETENPARAIRRADRYSSNQRRNRTS